MQAQAQFLSFALIGVAGLGVDMAALYVALHALGLGLYGGRLFSYLAAASFTWWLNRTFTFKEAPRQGAIRQWVRFLAANAGGGVANYLTYVGVLTLVPPLPILAVVWPYVGTAAGSLVGLGFNFTASKWLVFRP